LGELRDKGVELSVCNQRVAMGERLSPLQCGKDPSNSCYALARRNLDLSLFSSFLPPIGSGGVFEMVEFTDLRAGVKERGRIGEKLVRLVLDGKERIPEEEYVVLSTPQNDFHVVAIRGRDEIIFIEYCKVEDDVLVYQRQRAFKLGWEVAEALIRTKPECRGNVAEILKMVLYEPVLKFVEEEMADGDLYL